MGVIGVPEVKKSIFRLWSGIVLGWSEWPKNAPKRPKNQGMADYRLNYLI